VRGDELRHAAACPLVDAALEQRVARDGRAGARVSVFECLVIVGEVLDGPGSFKSKK
jgi:hypothetical protein